MTWHTRDLHKDPNGWWKRTIAWAHTASKMGQGKLADHCQTGKNIRGWFQGKIPRKPEVVGPALDAILPPSVEGKTFAWALHEAAAASHSRLSAIQAEAQAKRNRRNGAPVYLSPAARERPCVECEKPTLWRSTAGDHPWCRRCGKGAANGGTA